MTQTHYLTIMIITETKVSGSRAKEITDRLHFDRAIHANSIGYSSGLWILWDSTQEEVSKLSTMEQEIHAIVKDLSSNASWLMSAIYASPRYAERRLLWDNLSKVAKLHTLHWIIVGDFNEVLLGEDKFRGRPISISRAINLQECLNTCGMINLGFFGPPFTWTNRQPLPHLVQERIDRVFVNADWNILYLEACVKHMERSHSDPSPVLLSLRHDHGTHHPQPFRSQPIWLSYPSFPGLVSDAWLGPSSLSNAITTLTTKARIWNRDHFGNIFNRKRRIYARLKGVQTALRNNPNNFLIELEKSLLSELSTIVTLEANFWSIKSRISWVVEGDRNIAFFHNSTLIQRRRNCITSLKDRMGNWLNREHEIANFTRQGFLDLFTTSQCSSSLKEWQPPFRKSRLNDEDRSKLELPITDEKIFAALQSLKPYKAPRPNRLHVGFFQWFWPVMGPTVKTEVNQIFCFGKIPKYLNRTLITLISKCNSLESLNNFWPIGLCNTVYKVITKLLVARIQLVLDYLISSLQTAFVPKRKGVDNAIIVQELIHSMSKKKGKEGLMAIKIDLEKAYDRLEWSFIRDTCSL